MTDRYHIALPGYAKYDKCICSSNMNMKNPFYIWIQVIIFEERCRSCTMRCHLEAVVVGRGSCRKRGLAGMFGEQSKYSGTHYAGELKRTPGKVDLSDRAA